MVTIKIKKSELALYKSLGKSNDEIAKKYNITTKEVVNAMITFGLVKTRKEPKVSGYQIVLENDTEHLLEQFENPESDNNLLSL
jgi:hypothetical protein